MNNLIDILDKSDFKKMEDLKQYLLDLEINYIKYIIINNKNYSRNIIYRNKIYEIIIITWMPHQFTKLHKHPKNGCLMKVLKGELNEIIFSNQNKYMERKLNENTVTFIKDKLGKHIISNVSKKPCITLHIYSPPNYYNNIL